MAHTALTFTGPRAAPFAGRQAQPAPGRSLCAVAARRAACPGTAAGSPALRQLLQVCLARSGGAGVVDAPSVTTSPTQGTEHSYKRPPMYKVFLHNDTYNKREYVVKVLLKVIDTMTVDDAVVVMQEAHEQGLALVVACPQEDAERYCEGLRLNGLTSSIEPNSC